MENKNELNTGADLENNLILHVKKTKGVQLVYSNFVTVGNNDHFLQRGKNTTPCIRVLLFDGGLS
jgi:hypothetical protein